MLTIEETADNMFKSNIRIQSILSTVRELKNIVDLFKNASKNNDLDKVGASRNYNFTGQHTDIAFADENGAINFEEIKQIKDDELRNNVQKAYSDAVKDGYIQIENSQFNLTEKGKQHINSEAFKEQFKKDQLNNISANKAVIHLKGTSSDINVFRYCDSININKLSFQDPAKFKKVVSYFQQCEKYGFVNISDDGIVKPTEKCLKYFEQNSNYKFNIYNLKPDKVVDFSKTVSQMSQTAGKKIALEGIKTAAQTSAKATAAASGAATAGIGTAVTAAIDLTTKGIKELNKSTDIHNHTTQALHNR